MCIRDRSCSIPASAGALSRNRTANCGRGSADREVHMEPTHIGTSIEEGVGFITIDRPERFNSLDVRTAQDLRRAGLAMARDSEVRVVVLSGVSRASGVRYCLLYTSPS